MPYSCYTFTSNVSWTNFYRFFFCHSRNFGYTFLVMEKVYFISLAKGIVQYAIESDLTAVPYFKNQNSMMVANGLYDTTVNVTSRV